jgi:FixJ family two-component response regulator
MPDAPLITVAVIDDDDSIRKALTRTLTASGLEVRVFPSANEFLASEEAQQVSCVVSDLRMPGVDGLELQRALADRLPHLAMVFMTGHADVSSGVHAMKAGAVDFLEKPVKSTALLEAIDRAVRRSLSARAQAAELDKLSERHSSLTPREREVFALVAAGLLNKQIAAELGIAEKTVKQHRGSVMDKMDAESLAHLVLMAERLGVRPAGRDFSRAKGQVSDRRNEPAGT